ncbi:hypothetical protein LP414_23630 [Polaromonas sp. P1(28)-13]|nr:hypothetical protein LP414_23630 [Polaromonas sp. P1(28)-13]
MDVDDQLGLHQLIAQAVTFTRELGNVQRLGPFQVDLGAAFLGCDSRQFSCFCAGVARC